MRFLKWLPGTDETKPAISSALWENVERQLPFLATLGDSDRTRLRELAVRFLTSKEWTGAAGLVLTAEIQLSISLQACLLILNLGLDRYEGLAGIVVYPGDFLIPRQLMDDDGIVHEFVDSVLGEAWEGGPVLLSWTTDQDVPADGINVVIHEFAHVIDMADGSADGTPALHEGMSRQKWISDMQAAYDDFCRRDSPDRNENRNATIDPYAAENPAEFFAVCSETFFQAPLALQQAYPAVYVQLMTYYRQDPSAASQCQDKPPDS